MTTQQPEALRLAELLELAPEDGIEPQTAEDAAAGLRRLHAENESLHVERERNLNSIRVNNEIINKQRDENETLQAGYAAARLEIESLQARIKTMAEEHADELMVAHLDGRMCGHSTEPAGVQQPGSAYADLMQEASDWICEHVQNETTGAMMWAIRLQSAAQKLRASLGQAPAQPAPAAQGWKAVPVNPTPEMWKAAKSVPDPNPPYPPHYGLVWDAMLAASPTPPEEQAAPEAAPAAQGDALDAACQRACMELPKGMGMAIQLERDAGWIELHDSYNDQIKLPNADGSLAEQVHQAIDAARAAQGGKT